MSSQLMFARRLGPNARLAIWLAVGLAFVVADARYHALEGLRGVLAGVVTPAREAVVAPGELAGQLQGFLTRHRSLQTQRDALLEERGRLIRALDRLRDVKRENAELRRLLKLAQRQPVAGVSAEILQQGRGWFTQTIELDRGADAGIQSGQAVVDAQGLIGQVVRVYDSASEVVLLTQAGHLTPIYIERTGQRGLVAGDGSGQLALRYQPAHADVRAGDRVLTSGIDRVYPPGVPVGRVTRVARLQNTPYLRIAAVPLAGVNRSRAVRVLQSPAPGMFPAPPLPPAALEPATAAAPADTGAASPVPAASVAQPNAGGEPERRP